MDLIGTLNPMKNQTLFGLNVSCHVLELVLKIEHFASFYCLLVTLLAAMLLSSKFTNQRVEILNRGGLPRDAKR